MGKQWKHDSFLFLGSKITVDGDCSREIKRCLLLERKAMTTLDCILKSRDITCRQNPSSQRYGFSSSHVWTWELDYKEGWALKNWCFWTVVLEKTLASPLYKIKPINPKGNQPWIFIGMTIAKAEVPILQLTLCDPMNHSIPGLPVHHQLLEFTQTHVQWVGDAIQPSHPLLSPSPPALNLFQHQGLFQWVSSSHQVAKVLEFQLQHQSFQWTPRTDL